MYEWHCKVCKKCAEALGWSVTVARVVRCTITSVSSVKFVGLG
jgi:hypothetical protein